MRTVLAAPDKFRTTMSALRVVEAIADACTTHDVRCDGAPMADGGEGTLDVVSGSRRRTTVTGPLGEPVEAEWVLRGTLAVIEMAQASGLVVVGGPEANDPLVASTTGTGELIAAAVRAGAKTIVVGLGGSASTDGGLGCVEALSPNTSREIDLVAAADVWTTFLDAPVEFGPQKGASESQVKLLEGRLARLADRYRREFGVDVTSVPGSGAAGGLGGGLLALGGRIVNGFEMLADLVELEERMERADLVITGEGWLDSHSFDGKVVGGVVEMARRMDRKVWVVVGEVGAIDTSSIDSDVSVHSLVERYGRERAVIEPDSCVRDLIAELLEER